MYKKILVPLDGSEASLKALDEAAELAKLTKGEITIIHVYSMGTSLVISESQEHFQKLAIKNGEALLLKAKETAKNKGFNVKKVLLEGDPVEQIVKTAHEGYFELIVMGASGLSGFKEFFLGSVSHGVIKSAPCPVLVTR